MSLYRMTEIISKQKIKKYGLLQHIMHVYTTINVEFLLLLKISCSVDCLQLEVVSYHARALACMGAYAKATHPFPSIEIIKFINQNNYKWHKMYC